MSADGRETEEPAAGERGPHRITPPGWRPFACVDSIHPHRRLSMPRILLALLLLVAPAAAAQVVETPQAFDSAGRLMAITPSIAARLQLGPPAWRVIGDYTEARLYSVGGDAYVLAVTRRDGSV